MRHSRLDLNFDWAVIDKISFLQNCNELDMLISIAFLQTIFKKRWTNPLCPIYFVAGTYLVFHRINFQFLPVVNLSTGSKILHLFTSDAFKSAHFYYCDVFHFGCSKSLSFKPPSIEVLKSEYSGTNSY